MFRSWQPNQAPLATAGAQATTTCGIYILMPASQTESHFHIAHVASPVPTGLIRLLTPSRWETQELSWIRRLSSARSLLPGAQTQQSCCEPRVRDSSQLCDCVPAGFRMIITSGEDLFIFSSFGKASSLPMISLLVCFPHCLDKDPSFQDVECAFHGLCKTLAESEAPRFADLQYL